MSDPDKGFAKHKGSILQVIGAVFWSFFGVRRSSDNAQDMAKLNPVHVVIAGVVGAAIFIAILFFLVKWVVASGVAT